MRPHHTCKTSDDINNILCGARIFSKLDARSWILVCDVRSQFQYPYDIQYTHRAISLQKTTIWHKPDPRRFQNHME